LCLLRRTLATLLLRTLAVRLRLTRAAASATPSAPVAGGLLARGALLLLLLLLLRRALLLLRPLGSRSAFGPGTALLGTGTALLLRLLGLPSLLLLPGTLPVALAPVAGLLLLRPLVLPHFPAGALLEFAHLLVHVTRGVPLLLEAQLVVPAVRAALPSLGIGLLTCGAKDAFRERHREIGAHCTLRAVDESRRRTLLTLIHLAEENSPSACWDDRRAMELLRKEATAGELRELGMGEELIAQVFAEEHAG
jgi:hypothetical protein